MKGILPWLLVAASFALIKADFGDYADPSFNCPATTTCPQVCVANVSDCPIEMLCNGTETLCADGTCSENCDPNAATPCAYNCAPIACAKNVIDYFDRCEQVYKPYYDYEAQCGAAEVAAATTLLTFKEPAFLFFYCWISIVSVLVVAWCFYNQRFDPVSGSTQPLQVDSVNAERQGDVTEGWQTGYKIHPVGLFIHFLTLVTLWGFQVLLAWLTVQYYIENGSITSPFFHQQFDDDQQCLKTFEITWSELHELHAGAIRFLRTFHDCYI